MVKGALDVVGRGIGSTNRCVRYLLDIIFQIEEHTKKTAQSGRNLPTGSQF